jgi:hypothetical protein
MCLPRIVTELTPIWVQSPSGILLLVYTLELRKNVKTLTSQFLYSATENDKGRFLPWFVLNTVLSSGPLYSLPSGVKSPYDLLYSGNPPPSPASPPPLPCDRRFKPIPTPPRSTLYEALLGGCVSYLGIDLTT